MQPSVAIFVERDLKTLYSGHFVYTVATLFVQWPLCLYSGHFVCTVATLKVKRMK